MSTVYVASAPRDGSDPGIGRLDEHGFTLLAHTPELSSLATHPARPLVYGVSRADDGDSLTVWRQSDNGRLAAHGSIPVGGESSCAVAVAPDGTRIAVAHYESAQVTLVDLRTDGLPTTTRRIELRGSGPEAGRQETAHPHHVLWANDELLVTDLGADTLWRLAPDGTILSSTRLPSGSGGRHCVLLADGRAAVSGELDETIMVVDETTGLVESAPSTRRRAQTRNYPSDVVRHDSGLVIIANRGVDSLAVFRIDGGGVQMTDEVDTDGAWPLNLEIDRETVYSANRDSDSVAVFRLDPEAGLLRHVRTHSVPRPTWVTRTTTH